MGLTGNEKSDRLAKIGSQFQQTQNPVTYREAKTLLHSRCNGEEEGGGGFSMRTKLSIFNTNVKSVLLYGCEAWRTTQTMQQKILSFFKTFFNTCLRRIYKIQWQQKIRNGSERDRNQ